MHKQFLLFGALFFLLILPGIAQESVGWWRWLNPRPQGNPLFAIQFRDAQTGIAVGRDGIILRTENSGNEWKVVQSPVRTPLYGLSFLGKGAKLDSWVAVGARGVILKSRDDGT